MPEPGWLVRAVDARTHPRVPEMDPAPRFGHAICFAAAAKLREQRDLRIDRGTVVWLRRADRAGEPKRQFGIARRDGQQQQGLARDSVPDRRDRLHQSPD